MRAPLIACLAFCSLVPGCKSVYSAHPLYTAEDAVEEPSLVGEWRSDRNPEDGFCIEKGEGATYSLIVSSVDSQTRGGEATTPGHGEPEKPSKVVEAYKIRLVSLDNQLFADMTAGSQLVDGTEVEAPAGAIYHHVIIKLEVIGTDLDYWLLDTDALREANENGYAPLTYVAVDDSVLLTESTEELRWAVSRYADRLFLEQGERFIRVTDTSSGGSPVDGCGSMSVAERQ